MIAENKLNIRLGELPPQNPNTDVTVSVNHIIEYIKKIIFAKPGFFKQHFQFFYRVTVQVRYYIGHIKCSYYLFIRKFYYY